jgi:hypothetical protein
MEKEHSAILGQKIVKKQNDGINEVVHTSIPTKDRVC